MSPFKSSAGRALGKMLEGYKSSDIGKGFGSGGAAGPTIQATGGEVLLGKSVTAGNVTYKYHYFKAPGSLIFPDRADFNGDVDVLVVAGGGSGGNRSGGGGGAGGIAVGTNLVFPGVGQLSIPITVGDGGPVSGSPDSRGNNGSDSRFGSSPESYSFVAHGGGYGGGDGNTNGGPGGSGGGGHYSNNGGNASQPGANPGKSWVANYGYAGSTGHGAPQHNSGAGGGAGSAAVGGASNDRGAAGDGENFPIWDVTNYMPTDDPYWPGISPLPGTHYGGGGGGGDYPPYLPLRMPTNATNGGGGIGGPTSAPGHGTQGVDGLGGGGGGACGDSPGPKGGKGGNGIVVVRYRT